MKNRMNVAKAHGLTTALVKIFSSTHNWNSLRKVGVIESLNQILEELNYDFQTECANQSNSKR